jgi:predicted acyltransferase
MPRRSGAQADVAASQDHRPCYQVAEAPTVITMRSQPRSETVRASDEDASVNTPSRDLAIDRMRGVLIILMVGGDFLGGVNIVPAILKHAPDIGFTIADTVAPAFVFVIGLNYKSSFARWTRGGTSAAYRHFLVRYLALMGIGAVISGGTTIVSGVPTDWGVLQAIGAAGLICLAVIRLPTSARFAIGLLMLCGYQHLLDTVMLPDVLRSVQGGLFGALSWGALLVLSTAVADLWRRGAVTYVICCVVLAVAAGLSCLVTPVSKHRVSLSFVLITLAISAVMFFIFELSGRIARKREGIFCWWGQNSLMLYLVHLLLLGTLVLPAVAWWYSQAQPLQAAVQLLVILGVMSVIAWWTHRRKVKLEL